MRIAPAKLASFLVSCWLASVAPAQTLWHGTHYGMDYDEVKKMFPNSHDAGIVINGRKMVGPLLDTTMIADWHFSVSFFFGAAGNKLDRVFLTCTDKLMNAQGAAIGRHFLELLQAQYGEGKVGEDANKADQNDIEVVWITAEKTEITLSYFTEIGTHDGKYQMEIKYDGGRLRGASDL